MGDLSETGVSPVSYAAGCTAGVVIIVASLGVLYPAAVVMRVGRRMTHAFGAARPPRIATL